MNNSFDNLYAECINKLESGNFSEAIATLQELAAKGYPEAQYRLGLCFSEGKGVERDVEAAREWYSRAARDGYEDAINALHDLDGLLV